MSSMLELHLPQAVVQSKHVSYYVAIGAVLFVAWLLQPKKQRLSGIPFYSASKTRWIFDSEKLILDSYGKFRDRAYQIKATEGVQVLIPPNLIGELKGLPEDVLSATVAVGDALQCKYTNFCAGHNSDTLSYLLRSKLTQNLNRLIPRLKEELDYITATEFPECKDWTPIKFQPFSLRVISRLSGRAFVGPSVNRQEKWMDTSINYAIHVFTAVIKLQFFPEWFRPIGQYLVSELRQVKRDLATAKSILAPIIAERLQAMQMPGSGAEEPPDDVCQWLLEALPEAEKTDIETQAHLQLLLAASSIHTTNNLLTDCMYDLAAYPEVQEELREEAYQVLEVEQGWEKKESMSRLKKLDSFVKEVQRCSGNITSFIRRVMQPITLSDGTHLPAGTKLLSPLAGIAHDERYYPDPEKFDALRFYRIRQQSEEDSNRYQFTSVSDANMNFGAGKHACPGRFFASNEIKMALAFFLINYDVRQKKGDSRPKPMVMVMIKSPSATVELEFRRRSIRE